MRQLEGKQTELDKQWGDLYTIVDAAKDRVEAASTLTNDERAALASTPFTAPTDTGAVALAASLRAAIGNLRDQIELHQQDREKLEAAVVAHIAAYRNLDDRTARETDGTIDSLTALLAIYQ